MTKMNLPHKMNRRNISFVLFLLLTGCVHYRERFTYIEPTTGQTNHVVDVQFYTFLVWGQASKLKTETQTEEFIRSVNADGALIKGDSESIKAIGAAIGQAAAAAAKASAGIP